MIASYNHGDAFPSIDGGYLIGAFGAEEIRGDRDQIRWFVKGISAKRSSWKTRSIWFGVNAERMAKTSGSIESPGVPWIMFGFMKTIFM